MAQTTPMSPPCSFPVARFSSLLPGIFSLFRDQESPQKLLQSQWLAKYRDARKRRFSL
jgi:hypothetical protein